MGRKYGLFNGRSELQLQQTTLNWMCVCLPTNMSIRQSHFWSSTVDFWTYLGMWVNCKQKHFQQVTVTANGLAFNMSCGKIHEQELFSTKVFKDPLLFSWCSSPLLQNFLENSSVYKSQTSHHNSDVIHVRHWKTRQQTYY